MKTPESIFLKLGNNIVEVIDDEHSDRVRCDHPNTSQGQAVAFFLAGAAHCQGRTKVLTMVEESLSEEFTEVKKVVAYSLTTLMKPGVKKHTQKSFQKLRRLLKMSNI